MDRFSLNNALKHTSSFDSAIRSDALNPPGLRAFRVRTEDQLAGRIEGRGRSVGGSPGFGRRLTEAVHRTRPGSKASSFSSVGDRRQRAIVKVHYFAHANGGGGALKAHAKYLARDGAARDVADASKADEPTNREGPFYSEASDNADGGKAATQWARSDRRHFRIILSPENASSISDLREYTRDVMRRAEAALGTRLQWVAVDHWDTGSPHTHIILRGVRDDGRDLVIPRDFIRHGFRSAARDAATDRLGERSRDDARKALRNEVRAHRVTRLDLWIASQLDAKHTVRIAALRAPVGGPEAEDALKERARELHRLGLAKEISRNVLQFESGWRDALHALERHLDIRKALVRARTLNASPPVKTHSPLSRLLRGSVQDR